MNEAPVFLTSTQVLIRWNQAITNWTLERWRSQGSGPRFLKIGGRVLYALEDIESYEASTRRSSTRQKAPAR